MPHSHVDNNRAKILRGLAELHKAGCHLLDLRERNVVVKDGQYRFIDLEDVSEHECCFRGEFIPDANRPPRFMFGCDILFDLAVEMGIWKDSEFITLDFSSIIQPQQGCTQSIFSGFCVKMTTRNFHHKESQIFLLRVKDQSATLQVTGKKSSSG